MSAAQRVPAIVFQAPQRMAVRRVSLRPATPGDVDVAVLHSGISTGTERLLWDGRMPPFPGLGYPLVPGYEAVGEVLHAPEGSRLARGDRVFVPGSHSFTGVHNLFGAAASQLRVPADRVVPLPAGTGAEGVLLALAATAYHAVAEGGRCDPHTPPDLIIGHGVLGRLLARLTVAAGLAPPTVWETDASRREGADGYPVIDPAQDGRRDYRAIYDVSGDIGVLHQAIPRLQVGGEVVLAGFYAGPMSFDPTAAFLREARIRVSAEWKRPDLLAVTQLVEQGRLSLAGLVTHHEPPSRARQAYRTAFGDTHCLKMVLDWRH